jgi:hypothetical protein
VREKLALFFPIVAGVENKSALVEGLEQDDSHERLIAIPNRPKGHRIGFRDDRAVELFGEGEDASKPLDRIWWDQLIPRHRRIDFIDPAQNPAGEISDVRHARFGKLLRRVHAAHADLAVVTRG